MSIFLPSARKATESDPVGSAMRCPPRRGEAAPIPRRRVNPPVGSPLIWAADPPVPRPSGGSSPPGGRSGPEGRGVGVLIAVATVPRSGWEGRPDFGRPSIGDRGQEAIGNMARWIESWLLARHHDLRNRAPSRPRSYRLGGSLATPAPVNRGRLVLSAEIVQPSIPPEIAEGNTGESPMGPARGQAGAHSRRSTSGR
jgi:hypothetical protein